MLLHIIYVQETWASTELLDGLQLVRRAEKLLSLKRNKCELVPQSACCSNFVFCDYLRIPNLKTELRSKSCVRNEINTEISDENFVITDKQK